jgi:hypothetical protein
MNREGRRDKYDPLDEGYHSDEGLNANYRCSLCDHSCAKRYTIKCVKLVSDENDSLVAKYVICNNCVRSDADSWVQEDGTRVEI